VKEDRSSPSQRSVDVYPQPARQIPYGWTPRSRDQRRPAAFSLGIGSSVPGGKMAAHDEAFLVFRLTINTHQGLMGQGAGSRPKTRLRGVSRRPWRCWPWPRPRASVVARSHRPPKLHHRWWG
jgi:hypothetical protein